jgi:hypothetical protein
LDPRSSRAPVPRSPHGEPQGRFTRGLSLAGKSWQVIRADRSLLVLPLIQVVFQAIALLAILLPIGDAAYQDNSKYVFLVGIAAVAFPLNFVATFCGVAFVFVLRAHLRGEQATLGEAIRFARSRLDAITGWALLTTAVSLAIQALERVRGGVIAARVAGWLLGAAWGLATLFVFPALAADNIGPIAAAKKSAGVVKQKWGEGIVASTAVGLAAGLAMIPVMVIGVIGFLAFSGSPAVGAALMAVAVAGFVLVSALQSAVDGVFRFVLFDYAENGTVHAPFTQADLESAFKPKAGGVRRLFGA